ncbi:MAG: hypothetical protein KAS04_03555 [Candidatus Aenigmarchaeota archaeon]|nr:hypothetical protein [Candidatus Aenigmarchaeota archaeon]
MIKPVELYTGFDNRFFKTRQSATNGAADEAEIAEPGSIYKSFLDGYKDAIDAVILDEAQPEDIENEFYSKLNELVRSEHLQSTSLRNHYDVENEFSIPDLCNSEGLPQLTKGNRPYASSRISSHLYRLYDPRGYHMDWIHSGSKCPDLKNHFCKEFTKGYVAHAFTIENPCHEDYMKIRYVIGTEGNGTFAFWTIAPYVYQGLIERGMGSNDAMKNVFDWIRRAHDRAPEERGDKGRNNHFEHTRFNRFGMYINSGEPLGFDERMPSHLRSRLISKTVSREL